MGKYDRNGKRKGKPETWKDFIKKVRKDSHKKWDLKEMAKSKMKGV